MCYVRSVTGLLCVRAMIVQRKEEKYEKYKKEKCEKVNQAWIVAAPGPNYVPGHDSDHGFRG